jgi:hypothetical protein
MDFVYKKIQGATCRIFARLPVKQYLKKYEIFFCVRLTKYRERFFKKIFFSPSEKKKFAYKGYYLNLSCMS